MKNLFFAVMVILITLSFKVHSQSFDIGEEFSASGKMGDTDNIEVFSADSEDPYSPPNCFKFRYKPGKLGWAGIYWLNLPNNWGDRPSNNFSEYNYTKIVFWAKGEIGGEIIEFKAGNLMDKQFKDSFSARTEKKRTVLTDKWTRYEIDLTGQNLSSVIGGFVWVVSASDNPKGVTFYLDDIKFVCE
jgi:hypothetical protein